MRFFSWATLVAALLALTSCKSRDKDSSDENDSDDDEKPAKKASETDKNDKPAKPVLVLMDTTLGKIEIELYPDRAPRTVKNFLSYVDDKFYDGTLFHRVIAKFMIQGGGSEPGPKKKETKPPIKNEGRNGLLNERGTIAMGLVPGDPDSATSEFFINAVDNDHLNPNPENPTGYCVFGKVTEGMDVVDRINRVRTGRNDIPLEDVIIKSIRRLPQKKAKAAHNEDDGEKTKKDE